MSRKYAARLTPGDECVLRNIRECGFITVDSRGIASAGIESNKWLPNFRVKRLLFLGYLTPNNDGLLDGCPQTYSVRTPD